MLEQTKRWIRRHVPGRLSYDIKSLALNRRPVGPLPDFIIIGTQKGGTTALFEMLSRHPEVSPSRVKEVHYFDINYHRGERWYRRHFHRTDAQRCGEASPYYLYHPMVPDRLKALVPAARLIVILRDPVERALSHYFHSVRRGYETLPMLEALMAEDRRLSGAAEGLDRPDGTSFAHQHFSYLARSRYPEQIERWRKRFDDSRILLLSNRDLRASPDQTYARVCEFLDITTIPAPSLTRELGGGNPEAPKAAREYLTAQLSDVAAVVKAEYGLTL